MGLESTMVCLDNSEWMRNGDYTPTRMEAQHDACNLVCGSKTQSNPESTVGVMTMANNVQVLCSPTDDMGKILAASANIQIGGKSNFGGSMQIAQLALKHRKNKNGGQRIVAFVGSPITTDEKKLQKIAKQLKKANIAVDIVSMGESDENEKKLEAFIDTVNKNNNSHLVAIPRGTLPSDVLITSPIITGEDGTGGAGLGGGGGGDFGEFGFDASLDPELAIALRVSMEEARQEAEKKAQQDGKNDETNNDSSQSTTNEASSSNNSSNSNSAPMSDEMDEDEMLQQALMMSMSESNKTTNNESSSSSSKQDDNSNSASAASSFLDPNFVQGLLQGLPGVDVNNPAIQAALARSNENEDDEEDEKKKKKDKSKKKDK